jgi:hypothetical protein
MRRLARRRRRKIQMSREQPQKITSLHKVSVIKKWEAFMRNWGTKMNPS